MTDRKSARGGVGKILTDVGPAIIFMIAYNLANRYAPEGQAVYWATGAFIPATLAALGYTYFVQKRLPPLLMVTAVVVVVFGALTFWLQSPTFAYIKPTIINLLFAAAIFGGLLFRQNVWKVLFESSFDLPDRIWTIFAVRWGVFYIFLAALNEVVWRNTSEAFWANFKLLGVLPITFLFILANAPLILKHQRPEPEAAKGG